VGIDNIIVTKFPHAFKFPAFQLLVQCSLNVF